MLHHELAAARGASTSRGPKANQTALDDFSLLQHLIPNKME